MSLWGWAECPSLKVQHVDSADVLPERKTSLASVNRLVTGTVPLGDVARRGHVTGGMPAQLRHFSADERPMAVWNLGRRNDRGDRPHEGSESQATLAGMVFPVASPFLVLHSVAMVLWTFG